MEYWAEESESSTGRRGGDIHGLPTGRDLHVVAAPVGCVVGRRRYPEPRRHTDR